MVGLYGLIPYNYLLGWLSRRRGEMIELLLFLGGAAMGFVNTLASGGTAISLPLLLFLGLPPHIANATNRLTLLADWLSDEGLMQLIVLAVFLSLVLALVGRRRILTSTEEQLVRLGPVQISLLFLVGIWAGIIVLDTYTYLLIVLVLGAGSLALR